MSRVSDVVTVSAPAVRRAGVTCAPLPTITLLLSIGSLALPLTNHCTG